MKPLQHLFTRNQQWADSIKEKSPDFFNQLSLQQTPKYLWIGCADSRVPATQVVNLPPGEMFVHRNIANVVVHTDANCLSVIEYAITALKIEHIIVCGHYGCGGVKAAMDPNHHGVIDQWLNHIKNVAALHENELTALAQEQRFSRLCELNVMEQVRNVGHCAVVQDAWRRGDKLSLYGWIYNMKDGILKDLGISISSAGELQPKDLTETS